MAMLRARTTLLVALSSLAAIQDMCCKVALPESARSVASGMVLWPLALVSILQVTGMLFVYDLVVRHTVSFLFSMMYHSVWPLTRIG